MFSDERTDSCFMHKYFVFLLVLAVVCAASIAGTSRALAADSKAYILEEAESAADRADEACEQETRDESLSEQAQKIYINDASVQVEDATYTGEELTTKISVRVNGKMLCEGSDYTVEYFDNIDVGTALVAIRGAGNYQGLVYEEFEILPASISEARFSLSSRSFVYDGTEKIPDVSVVLKGKTLRAGTDYTLVVSERVGDPFVDTTVNIVIKGRSNYTGTLKTSYTIKKNPEVVKKSIDVVTVSPIPTQNWTGSAITPSPTLTYNGETLVVGTDYTLSYRNNINPGTATVVITGAGLYYKDSREVTFTIYKQQSTTPGGSGGSGTGTGGGSTTGGGSGSGQKPATDGQKMFRLYNPNSGEHFYTASFAEDVALVRAGWRYEGIAWTAPKKSNTPVYRLYNPNAGDHHYTTSLGERNALVKVGWRYEGIGWYSDDNKGTALYRQYNPNARAGSHNYTASKAENNMLVRIGWRAEGIGWYGLK